MSEHVVEMTPQLLRKLFWPPVWDPIPEWLELDRERLTRFAELEIQFKIRELQIQQEKLEQFKKVIL